MTDKEFEEKLKEVKEALTHIGSARSRPARIYQEGARGYVQSSLRKKGNQQDRKS